MAAAGSSVVKRVEELGDLAQAHIQQLSEAAGEDGEGETEKGGVGCGRRFGASWCSRPGPLDLADGSQAGAAACGNSHCP